MIPSRLEAKLRLAFPNFPRSPFPRDRHFRRLLRQVPGMASENKLMLLHVVAALVPPNEAYVEVGSLFGLSIIAAASANRRSTFFAVDDFSQFGGSVSVLRDNLARFGMANRVVVLEGDCFELLRRPSLFAGREVGAFFYDGDHSYEAQFRALCLIERHLADRAFLIIDDTSYPAVRRATAAYTRFHPECRLLWDIPSPGDGDPVWWNGIQVFAYCRHRGRRRSNLHLALRRHVAARAR